MSILPQQSEKKPRIVLRPRGDGTYEVEVLESEPEPGVMNLGLEALEPLMDYVHGQQPGSYMNLGVVPQDQPVLKGRVERTGEPPQVPSPGGGLGGAVLGALLQFGAQYLANKLAPPKVEYVHDGPLIPSLPVRPSVSLPMVEMLPARSISVPQPAPSQMIQNRAYQEALNKLNEAKKQNLERKLERNAPRNTSPLLREMTEKSASLTNPALPSQPLPSEYQPALDSTAQVAFQNLLNPASASQPFIQEDQNWIRGNLAYAAKPVSTADYLRNLQAREFARQQAEAQQRLIQEQIQLAQAQRRALQLQQWAREYHSQKPQQKVSDNLIADSKEIMIDVPDNLLAESGSTLFNIIKRREVFLLVSSR